MRNLRNIRLGTWNSDSNITEACWDPSGGEVLVTLGPSEEDPTIKLVRVAEKADDNECGHREVASWNAPPPSPDVPCDRVVSIHYSDDTSTTCVVLAGGDLVTVAEKPGQDGAHIEIVGSMDTGITAASWSPDGELLAVTTRDGNLTLVGRTFDPVAEAAMRAEDLSRSKHVSVGWGKKETQFQGRGAKALRDPTIPEKVDEGEPSPNDDGSTTISWRGDGAYVAVNGVEAGKRRVVRVYTRDGVLDSVSEPVDGLEAALSWRPAGNLVAGIQRLGDRIDVVFFERNGLRHGQFALRTADVPAAVFGKIQLAWNSDSTVLAVALGDRVQLWVVGNYHWYLKQEIALPSGPSGVAWHPEKPLRMALVSLRRALVTEYVFATARATCVPPLDSGAVAVVDGRTLKLTPFRTANLPPPMSMFEVELESPAVDVAFGSRNAMLGVLHGQGVNLYRLESRNGRSFPPSLVRTIPLPSSGDGDVASPRQLAFSGDTLCHVLLDTKYGPRRYAVGVRGDAADPVICPAQLGGDVCLATCEAPECTEAYVQERSGAVSLLREADTSETFDTFPTFMPWFEVRKTEEQGGTAFGLSRNGHLYAGSRLLAKNCTSFLTTPNHLIYTTGNHFVKFIHLDDGDGLEVAPDDPRDERCRSIERGGRLVTAMPTNMSLVLQMPRGNLETIFPRAMVLAGIRRLVDDRDYAGAFSCCRSQRVDLNILYDHRPDQFLANVALFVDQVSDTAYIDLFLSSLKEEDVTQTTYKNTRRTAYHEGRDEGARPSPGPKATKVCDAILKVLETRKPARLQNIITANVCKNPPALEDGLAIVAGLMREDEGLAESAVEHICFLVDVNRLYDTALGLYDLDLALLVAQQSQRDPREYLPFVQGLHALPELRRRFAVDDHLRRREKALGHLKALDAFDEVGAYTERHQLYRHALGLYRYDEPRRRAITQLYAAHLESASRFRDAAIAHESLGNFARATACYGAAGVSYWRECLAAAQQQRDPPLSDSALEGIASSTADALWEAKEYAAAAQVHLDYLGSPETAVACLCKGYHFAEAIRLVVLRRRPELLAEAVDPGLADALSGTTEFLAECKGQLQAQLPRIAELRRKAEEDPLGFYEGERAGGADIPDNVSVATSRVSTNASLFTRYTGGGGSGGSGSSIRTGTSRATSKNRRREEKKRARGRKGTVYEEEYLVNSVRRLVERVEAAKAEVERLVAGLVRRDMAERARAAEGLMAEVVEACVAAVKEVFGQAEKDAQEPGAAGGGEDAYRPVGADAVYLEFLEGREKRQPPPVITALDRLSLLGVE